MEPSARNRLLLFAALISTAMLLATLVNSRLGRRSGSDVKPATARDASPRVQLPDLNGADWNLEERRGKVVFLNFWATWCPPCRQETPALVRLARKFRGPEFELVGVAMDTGGQQVVQDFVRRFRVDYPVLVPSRREIAASGMESLPTSYLVDRQGRVAKSYVGGIDEEEVAADIARLLGER
jgi:cytochrome c biogenesis protein CcmG, thiol:disulfide interchange protein DsbE